jgi:hypothetical protein
MYIMPISQNIYYEVQSGGLCRLHALNAYFGYQKISQQEFSSYIREYDMYLKLRFNVTTSCESFDLVNSDQTNLVSYILSKHKIYLRYYALNSMYNKTLDNDILSAKFVFVYNMSHIWGIRKVLDQYFKVDSMSGVSSTNINTLVSTKDIGLMVPVPLKEEWENKVSVINKILSDNKIKTKRQLADYLIKLQGQGDVLGELEVSLGVAVLLLEINMSQPPRPEFKKITDLVDRYNKFISVFTRGNYNKIDLILDHIPDMVFELVHFN